ncbi:MAG TPA: hypothetical protein VE545_09865, partial [Candidatus Dormibacteraeota bacterium]|nr:hypothetical protein [Candidatus Dormibacteraeota bacterium]
DGKISRYTVSPETFGVSRAPLEAVAGGTVQQNAAIISRLFDDSGIAQSYPRDVQSKLKAAADIVAVNAGAALVAAGISDDFHSATRLAHDAIRSGKAREKLAQLAAFSNQLP